MTFPDLPLVAAYNHLPRCYNFVAFSRPDDVAHVRFGEYNVVKNHSGVVDLFRKEIFAAAGRDDHDLFGRYKILGGGMTAELYIPACGWFKDGDIRRLIWQGRSTVFGQADPALVKRVLLESKLFDSVVYSS